MSENPRPWQVAATPCPQERQLRRLLAAAPSPRLAELLREAAGTSGGNAALAVVAAAAGPEGSESRLLEVIAAVEEAPSRSRPMHGVRLPRSVRGLGPPTHNRALRPLSSRVLVLQFRCPLALDHWVVWRGRQCWEVMFALDASGSDGRRARMHASRVRWWCRAGFAWAHALRAAGGQDGWIALDGKWDCVEFQHVQSPDFSLHCRASDL